MFEKLKCRLLFFLQVALDIEYHHTMLKSHLKVNPLEVIVGWYLLSYYDFSAVNQFCC